MKESWTIRKEKATEKVKIQGNTIDFPALEFPNLCLMAKARISSWSDVVLNMNVEEICKNYIINGPG